MPTNSPYVTLDTASIDSYFSTFTAKRAKTRAGVTDLSKPTSCKEGFKLGADPEAFIFLNDKPIPAVDIIPGTKQKPHKVDRGAVQVDGMAAEYNIDPVNTYEEWEKNHATVIKQLEGFLKPGMELRFIPSVKFEPELFDAAPDDAKELGCQPDFDAWTGGVNHPPEPKDPYVRCAGGHVHIGWCEEEDLGNLQHLLNCQDLGKQLDWFCGAWSVTQDADKIRRTLYGKMGAIRYKEYGLEYRVMSNFWAGTEDGRRNVWNRVNAAIHQMSNLYFPDRAPQKVTNWLREYINKGVHNPDFLYVSQYPVQSLDPAYCRI